MRRWNLLTSNGHVCRPTSFQLSRAATERPPRASWIICIRMDYIKQQIDRWKWTQTTAPVAERHSLRREQAIYGGRPYLWTTAVDCVTRGIRSTPLTKLIKIARIFCDLIHRSRSALNAIRLRTVLLFEKCAQTRNLVDFSAIIIVISESSLHATIGQCRRLTCDCKPSTRNDNHLVRHRNAASCSLFSFKFGNYFTLRNWNLNREMVTKTPTNQPNCGDWANARFVNKIPKWSASRHRVGRLHAMRIRRRRRRYGFEQISLRLSEQSTLPTVANEDRKAYTDARNRRLV